MFPPPKAPEGICSSQEIISGCECKWKNVATAVRERRAERSRRGRRERVTWKEKRAGRRLVWQDRGNRISWLRVHILTSRCLGAGRTLLSGCSGNSNYVHRYVYSLLVILQTWTAWENRVLTFHKYFSYTGAQGFELLCSWTYLIEFFFATVVNKDLHEISLSYCWFFFSSKSDYK